MIQITEKYNEFVSKTGRTFYPKIVINEKEYTNIFYYKESDGCESNESLSFGSTYSKALSFSIPYETGMFLGQKVIVYIGLKTDTDIEWIKKSTLNISKSTKSEELLNIECYDNFYLCDVGFFTNLTGMQSIRTIVDEQCAKLGIEYIDDFENVSFNIDLLLGLTVKEAIGYLAAYCGRNAIFDNEGKLKFAFYGESIKTITGKNYISPLQLNESDTTINSLTCITKEEQIDEDGNVDYVDKTLIAGEGFGITFSCLGMTQERLNILLERVEGFTYRSGEIDLLQGFPEMEAGDVVELIDLDGNSYIIPIMEMTSQCDGGYQSVIKSKSQTEQDEQFQGSLSKKVERTYTELGSFKKVMADEVNAFNGKFNQVDTDILNVSKEFNALKGTVEDLDVGSLETTYAKTDFSNVGTEHVDSLFVKSGVFEEVTGEEGIIYELKSVKFDGDLIKANTIMADSLIITGEDGLYYRLNAEGGHLTQEQLADEIYQKYLDGTNIVANSVTADKINVNKLSALSSDLGDITGGSLNINDQFIVTPDGKMTAVSGVFSGKINATSGAIGGWIIDESSLTSPIIELEGGKNSWSQLMSGGFCNKNIYDNGTCDLLEIYSGTIYLKSEPNNTTIDITSEGIGFSTIISGDDFEINALYACIQGLPSEHQLNIFADSGLQLGYGVLFDGDVKYVVGGRNRQPIRFIEGDGNGDGCYFYGAGGLTAIGSGESIDNYQSGAEYSATSEIMLITSDQQVTIVTNLQDGYSFRKRFIFNTAGSLRMDGNVYTNYKASVADGAAGGCLNNTGNLYLVSESTPYIYLYNSLATSPTHSIGGRTNDFRFSKSISVNGGYYTGSKTVTTDGVAGAVLTSSGNLHLTSAGTPIIYFYNTLATSSTHSLQARSGDFYMNKPLTINGAFYVNTGTNMAINRGSSTYGAGIYCDRTNYAAFWINGLKSGSTTETEWKNRIALYPSYTQFSKPIRLSNDISIQSVNTSGTVKQIIGISSSDNIYIGSSDATNSTGNTNIYAGDSINFYSNRSSSSYKATGIQIFREQSDSHRTILKSVTNGGAYLGTTSYRWNTAFFTNAITASDLKEKDVIENFDFKVKDFIMGLEPIAYRRKGQGDTGNRIHIGLGAQTLAKHINNLGLGNMSMVQASVIDGENEKPYDGSQIDDNLLSWGINYTELIPYVLLMEQDHERRIQQLEEENKQLKQILKENNLLGEVA